MRRVMLMVLATVACAGSGDSNADTSAGTAAEVPAAGTLTAADIAGTWSGMTMTEGSDSVMSRWTIMRVDDTTGKLAYEGTADTVTYSVVFDADSMVATSVPYTSSAMPNGPQQTFRSVGRLADGKLGGPVTVRLASNPDSVIMRARWEATRVTP